MEPSGSVVSDVLVFGQDPRVVRQSSHSHNCYVSWSHKSQHSHKGFYYHQVCQRPQLLLKGYATPHPSRMTKSEPVVPCATPSSKETDGAQCSNQTEPRPSRVDEHPQPDVKPTHIHDHADNQMCETMFATARTLGILDLGASQTVMGQHQLGEFMHGLPESVCSQVFEQPVEMSFRFANNSVVPYHRAIFAPIDK